MVMRHGHEQTEHVETRKFRVSTSRQTASPEALKRELHGWYLYDFAVAAFGASASSVFIPILVVGPGRYRRARHVIDTRFEISILDFTASYDE